MPGEHYDRLGLDRLRDLLPDLLQDRVHRVAGFILHIWLGVTLAGGEVAACCCKGPLLVPLTPP